MRLNRFTLSVVSLFILISTQCVHSQFSDEFNKLNQRYPESSLIRLQDELIISVKIKNKDLEIKQTFIEESLYLDDAATYGSDQALSFSSFFELESVEATSYQFESGKYRPYKVEKFTEKDDLDGSFHDDTKSLNFIYPNLSKGGKTKLQYTEVVKNPRFLSPIYFGDFYPIKSKKVTLIADKGINFRFQKMNMDDVNVQFSKDEKRGRVIYNWEVNDVDEFKYEPNIPSYNGLLPHIVPIITSYRVDSEEFNVLNNVGDLYKWYYSLVKDINLQPSDPELIELTKTLIKDKETDLEKVKAIYYWTQQNIKYIDFEYALGGFIPREANDVFQKKYGDCKDNSSILYEMLKIANLNGHLTWIGTRKIAYRYDEVPTPIVDNHMILSYIENDKIYYLDATGRYLPIDLPSSFIQGKEALISQGPDKYTIESVPIVEPSENSYLENSTLSIVGNTIIGSSELELSGYYKMDFFSDLEDENTETEIKEMYVRKVGKGSNRFSIDEFKEINKYSYDNDFKLKYKFNIKDYAKEFGDEIYVNLNLNKQLSVFKTDEARENDIEFRYKSHYNFKNELQIPEGYKAEYLPSEFNLSNNYFDCIISYAENDGTINYNHTITMKYMNLNPKQQKEVNKAIKEVEKNYNETVVLKKI